jgi:hypothetical protein
MSLLNLTLIHLQKSEGEEPVVFYLSMKQSDVELIKSPV